MKTAFYINEVLRSDLIKLKGIGPVLADRILGQRLFENRGEVIAVNGIGRTSLNNIEAQNNIHIQFSYGDNNFTLSDFLEVPMKMRNDGSGAGHWHAPRGSRLHKGVDVLCSAGQRIVAPIQGKITKYGYSKTGNTTLRYIEISGSSNDNRFIARLHYCSISNIGMVNSSVLRGDHIGFGQDVSSEYNDPVMLDHIHFELRIDGIVSDPTPYLNFA